MKKKLLSLPILLVFVLSVLSVNMPGVPAPEPYYIKVVPESTVGSLTLGENFTVSIYTTYGGFDTTGYQFTLYYNPQVLNGTEATQGEIIVGGTATFIAGPFDNEAGILSPTVGFYDDDYDVAGWHGSTGPGTLATVTFTVVGEGASNIILGSETKLYGRNMDTLEVYEVSTQLQHGYFQNTAETVTRDIAVTSITSPNPVFAGELVNIEVDVENQGDVNEAFSVTLYNETDVIGTENVLNLLPTTTTALTFTWDTAGVPAGNYTINATASTVPGEGTSDNTLDIEVEVIVPQHPPVAVITARDASDVYEEEIFDGTGSYDLDGGEIIAYEWDFDGDNVIDTTGAIVANVFTTGGIYEVKLIVTDSQNQKGATTHTILIEDLPPAYAADLVRWKAKPEAHHWKYSWDVDKNVTLTALAGNLGTNPNDVKITFAIIDASTGLLAGPVRVEDVTLGAGATVPVSIEIDPTDYGYTGTKMVLLAHVTLKYDSDGDGTPDTDASTKIVRFAVVP